LGKFPLECGIHPVTASEMAAGARISLAIQLLIIL
jgi:hypothetical protein